VLPSWLDFCRPALRVALVDKACAQQSWLGRSGHAWSLEQSIASGEPAQMLTCFDQLLATRPASSKKRLPLPACVSVTLPDSVARYNVLPWAPDLMQPDELRQFAIERFDIAGQQLRDGWTVQVEWKNRHANTLAYALPNTLLDDLQKITERHGLTLNHVVPITALAHYGQLGLVKRSELRVLQSGITCSALLYRDGKLACHLVETVRGTASESIRRLISRLQISELTPDTKLDRIGIAGLDPIHLKELIDADSINRIRTLNPIRWGEWL
jgi:hypothetical protein